MSCVWVPRRSHASIVIRSPTSRWWRYARVDGGRRALVHPQCKGCERLPVVGPVVSKFAGEESRDRIPLVRSERIEIIADLTARLPPIWYAPAEDAPCCVNCKIMPYDSQLNSDASMSLTARDIARPLRDENQFRLIECGNWRALI